MINDLKITTTYSFSRDIVNCLATSHQMIKLKFRYHQSGEDDCLPNLVHNIPKYQFKGAMSRP